MDSCLNRAHLEGCDHYGEVQVSTLRGAEEQEFEPKIIKMDQQPARSASMYVKVSHKLEVEHDHQTKLGQAWMEMAPSVLFSSACIQWILQSCL